MSGRKWTDNDIGRLKELWDNHTAKEISDTMDRSTGSIYKKVQRLNITCQDDKRNSGTRWTDKEEKFLKDNWESMISKEIASELNRKPVSVRGKARRMDLPRKAQNNTFKRWTDDEEMYLIKNHKSKREKEMANCLDRSIASVNRKKNRMDLNSFWEQWEDEILFDLFGWPCKNIKELSEGMLAHRSRDAIQHRATRLGLKRGAEKVEVKCITCDKTFLVHPSQEDRRRHCSKECFYKDQDTKTNIEEKIEQAFKEHNIKYEYEYSIGPYSADFYLQGIDILVEADGDFWHQDSMNEEREDFLENEGYDVLHFTGTEIKKDVGSCIEKIKSTCGGV